ncbi:MAG: trypsin-like peptidase domain-containing protein [bacterium]|nr:trypsin-like peptidase domain-containing protein [bacterium]
MLEKIMGILLGVIGVTTTAVQPLTLPATNTTKTQTPNTETVAKNTTATNAVNTKNTKGEPNDFSKLKSFGSNSKTATTTSVVKSPSKKTPAKITPPLAATPKPVETSRPATSSLAASDLQTYQLINLPTNPAPPPPDWTVINPKTREALVNIICTSKYGGSFNPLSGSGVIIDPRGIILTNAHIAQYFLLENYRVKDFLTCIARTGSPAAPKYTLKLFYISKQWTQENYKNITSQKPMGTGENDYALLQITGSTNPDLKLPATFPFVAFDGNEDNIKTNDPTLLASYPAGFLGGIAIQRDLYIVSTIVNIGKRYTFKDGTLDAFSLGGSPVAQHGSSGGGAVSDSGKLIGIIVTSTDAEDTSKRDLDAISVAHINRSLSAEIRMTLDFLLASDIAAFGKKFDEETLPNLKKLLIDELDSKNR